MTPETRIKVILSIILILTLEILYEESKDGFITNVGIFMIVFIVANLELIRTRALLEQNL